MQTEQRFRELLDRYLAGNCTPQEKILMEEWFEEGGDRNKTDLRLSAADKARMLENIHLKQTAGSVAPESSVINANRHPFKYIFSGWRAAAVWIGMLMLAGTAAWWISNRAQDKASIATAYLTIQTGQGEIKQIILPDSSVVTLNAHSTLNYHPEFASHRQLRLSGEAFFSVAHDEKHPFTVVTGDSLVTTVLGTQFNINGYGSAQEIQITVVSGKVQVSQGRNAPERLTRSQGIRYHTGSRRFTRLATTSPENLISWMKGQWAYDNMQLNDLALLLNNQYGITLSHRHQNQRLQTGVSVNFSKQQTAKEIVETFCSFAGCRFRIIDDTHMEIY